MYYLTSLLLFIFTIAAYQMAKKKIHAQITQNKLNQKYYSSPTYIGIFAACYLFFPLLFFTLFWHFFHNSYIEYIIFKSAPTEIIEAYKRYPDFILSKIKAIANGTLLSNEENYYRLAKHYAELHRWSNIALLSLLFIGFIALLMAVKNKITPQLKARQILEKYISLFFFLASLIAILTTFGIFLSLLFEAFKFFDQIPILNFLAGTHWAPQNAFDEAGNLQANAFGALPIFTGTFIIALIALLIATPIGLFSAIYLSEYAPHKIRQWVKPLLETLAGIPTVVYGFFAAITVAPFMQKLGANLNLHISLESALTAGIVMGIMIVPFISSIGTDVISAVPQRLRDGSLGLGATQSETIIHVVLPAALPGILGGILLAFSRAIGETMIVVMAAGMIPNLTLNPFESMTTVTVQITALMTGDQDFNSPQTLAAYALALTLFILTLLFNILSLFIMKKYQEKYD